MKKVLKIAEVKFDEETYPRLSVDWVTCARYYNALKSGAVFPPIVVAKLNGVYYLVDGMHRLKSHRDHKESHIQCEVLMKLKNKREIYIEAVKRNIEHGRQFSTQEVTSICITLDKWKMSQEGISKIIHIPAEEIRPFVAKRMARISGTMEEVPLKAPLQNLSLEVLNAKPNQRIFNSRNQLAIIDSLISLLKNKWIDKGDEVILKKLNKLYYLLEPYKIKVRKTKRKKK